MATKEGEYVTGQKKAVVLDPTIALQLEERGVSVVSEGETVPPIQVSIPGAATTLGVPISQNTQKIQAGQPVLIQAPVDDKNHNLALRLFEAIYGKADDRLTRVNRLLHAFSDLGVFKDECHIFFSLARSFPKIKPDSSFLDTYMMTNRAIFTKSEHIDLGKYQLGDGDPYLEFVGSCQTLYSSCTKGDIDDESFQRILEEYKMLYVSEQTITVLESSLAILTEGLKVKGKIKGGYNDMRSFMTAEFTKLDNVAQEKKRKGLIVYGVNEDEEDNVATGIKRLGPYGIKTLDEVTGGIYTKDMISLVAPMKGGKSRCATYILHNMLVNGVSCLMWSIENGYLGWECLLRARHFNWYYNSGQSDVTTKRFINSDDLRQNKLPPDLKSMELASWEDLKNNTAYGRLVNVDDDFTEENCFARIDEAIRDVGVQFVCVDYLQLVPANPVLSQAKHERISNLYQRFLRYLDAQNIAGLFPGQIKTHVIAELARLSDAELESVELRDAGAESSEIFKTPSVNLLLYGTKESVANGNIKLISIPSRNSPSFPVINMYCDMGSCTFGDLS